jgi:hypothetical protein
MQRKGRSGARRVGLRHEFEYLAMRIILIRIAVALVGFALLTPACASDGQEAGTQQRGSTLVVSAKPGGATESRSAGHLDYQYRAETGPDTDLSSPGPTNPNAPAY